MNLNVGFTSRQQIINSADASVIICSLEVNPTLRFTDHLKLTYNVPITSFFLPLNATSCPKLRSHSLCLTPRDFALINKGLLSARDKSQQRWVSIPRPSDPLSNALPTELSWADDIYRMTFLYRHRRLADIAGVIDYKT